MSIYNNLNKYILFLFADKLNKSTVIKEYNAFNKADWASEESLSPYKMRKL